MQEACRYRVRVSGRETRQGPIGALVGSGSDKQEVPKPAMSITYRCDGAEIALFLTFNIDRFYRKMYDFQRDPVDAGRQLDEPIY